MTKLINLDNDTFSELKTDMTHAINALISNMEAADSEEGAVTVKLSVQLDTAADRNGEIQKIPKFTHKVGYAVKVEGKFDGCVAGVYSLQRDSIGRYALRPIDEQISVFDEPEEDAQ